MKQCVECGSDYEPKAHNQKYCTSACLRKATNKKIMENYYANKRRKAGEIRPCAECGTPLSRYNEGAVCEICSKMDAEEEIRAVIGGIIRNATRGKR